jgi:UDP-2,3-diacylglucosamine hydrolase
MTTFFISDLHLQTSDPEALNKFTHFMQTLAPKADALYILGDLFEAWIGDDDNSSIAKQVRTTLNQLTQHGIPCYVMRGNRDFALGLQFAKQTGTTLLNDPAVIELYGRKLLLMHGDLLCTDDVHYQAFRRKVYGPTFLPRLLSLPRFVRRGLAAWARFKSRRHTTSTALSIQDVNQNEVEKYLREHQATELIHGHTHRPDEHPFELDGQSVRRMVLPAWHGDVYALQINAQWEISKRYL